MGEKVAKDMDLDQLHAGEDTVPPSEVEPGQPGHLHQTVAVVVPN